MDADLRIERLEGWQRAVRAAKAWTEDTRK
jgi:hypothetical protein